MIEFRIFKIIEFVKQEIEDAKWSQFMGEERYNHCVAVCWNRFKMTEFVTQETEDAKRSQFMGEERYNHWLGENDSCETKVCKLFARDIIYIHANTHTRTHTHTYTYTYTCLSNCIRNNETQITVNILRMYEYLCTHANTHKQAITSANTPTHNYTFHVGSHVRHDSLTRVT